MHEPHLLLRSKPKFHTIRTIEYGSYVRRTPERSYPIRLLALILDLAVNLSSSELELSNLTRPVHRRTNGKLPSHSILSQMARREGAKAVRTCESKIRKLMFVG